MTRPLVILGTGGGVHDILDVVEALNASAPLWRPIGFLDDARPVGDRHLGIEVLGRLRDANRFGDCLFLNAIGSDKNYHRRPEILGSTGLPPERFATLVHPSASVSSRARLGRGVCVNFGASVAGNVTVGDHASIGPGCIVGHDAIVEDYAMLAPGSIVSGFARIGRSAYLGAGSSVRQHVMVGASSLVGLGAVVVRDVESESVVVGNPARPLASKRGEPVEGTCPPPGRPGLARELPAFTTPRKGP